MKSTDYWNKAMAEARSPDSTIEQIARMIEVAIKKIRITPKGDAAYKLLQTKIVNQFVRRVKDELEHQLELAKVISEHSNKASEFTQKAVAALAEMDKKPVKKSRAVEALKHIAPPVEIMKKRGRPKMEKIAA